MVPTVCLMLKAPVPGEVKTRLAVDLGAEAAATVYRTLVEKQLSSLPKGWAAWIFVSPPEAIDEMRGWLGTRYRYAGQCEGDLGCRLAEAGRQISGDGSQAILYLGGDCPYLGSAELEGVAALLDEHEAIIWPTADGGYCLLATRGCLPGLFERVPWSTASTCRTTIERAREQGVRLHVMDSPLEDVDDIGALQRAFSSGSIKSRG